MKVFFVNCPHCGKLFYSEMLLVEHQLPLHCPGCDTYFGYSLYSDQLEAKTMSTLTRIRKPLKEKSLQEILYIPKK